MRGGRSEASRARGNRKWRYSSTMLAVFLTVSVFSGPAPAGGVVDAGFCLRKSGKECERRVEFQATLSMKELPTDSAGNRVIYFYSLLEMEADEILLHVWERRGEAYRRELKPRMYLVPSMTGLIERLAPDLRESVRNLSIREGQNVFVIPVASMIQSGAFTVFSSRNVVGPGSFAARVLDVHGRPVPGSKLMEIRIIP